MGAEAGELEEAIAVGSPSVIPGSPVHPFSGPEDAKASSKAWVEEVTESVDEDIKQKYKEEFDTMDINGDGTVTVEELLLHFQNPSNDTTTTDAEAPSSHVRPPSPSSNLTQANRPSSDEVPEPTAVETDTLEMSLS